MTNGALSWFGGFPGIKHSVRRKLMVVVLATTLVALGLTGVALVIYDLRTYEQSWVNDLMTQADILGKASAPALAFDDKKVAQENLSLLKVTPKVLAAAIYTSQGVLFATYARDEVKDPKFPSGPGDEGYRIIGDQIMLFKNIGDSNGVLGTIYLNAHYELTQRLWNYLTILGAVMLLSLLLAVLLTSWARAAITQPILAMTAVARKVMTRRDYSLRVRKTTEDEIGYLVDTFNDMLTEVGGRSLALEEANRILEREMAERRSADKALIAADKRKDEFLAILAHELRNPLAPLHNALEILRNADTNPNVARSARDMMERQFRQLVHLVNELLDVSRITTGKMTLKPERVELRNILQNAIETAAPLIESRGHTLTLEFLDDPVYLYGDPTRIAQVFLNLLNNAAKFTEPHGQITVAMALRNEYVIVAVTDNGIGIPPAMLPIIFEMFAQVDRSLERVQAGLGVGLTLAKHLIELHGGTLEAYSGGIGKGSQFIVSLPILKDGALAKD